tara:strand:+ start:36429 stop:36920 length:492 start_codon:yes stop_codon:yes gene_type:complete
MQVQKQSKIQQLCQQLETVYNKFCIDKGMTSKSKPGPAASESEIETFEKEAGFKLPPSFREFISLHNGWQKCAGELLILPLKKQLEMAKQAAKQGSESQQFHLIGMQSEMMVLLMRGSASSDGEMKIQLILNADGETEELPHFTALLDRLMLSLNMLADQAKK